MDDAAGAIWSASGEGELLWVAGVALVTVIIPGEAVGGRFALMEFLTARDVSPPVHTHPQDETFYMFEGKLTLQIGTRRSLFEPGATALIPAGVKHTWRADSETVRFLVLSTPRGSTSSFATSRCRQPRQRCRHRTRRFSRQRRSSV